jgi:5'-nucleotidase
VKGQKWDSAATVAASVVQGYLANIPSEPVVINVNVPNCDVNEIKGWRRTGVGHIIPRAMSSATLEAKEGYTDSYYVRMNYGEEIPMPATTDGGAVENGEVAITYIGRLDDVAHHGTEEIHGELTSLVGSTNILHS